MKAKTKNIKKRNLIVLSKKLLLTFITFFLLTSCSNNEEVESSSFTPQNIPFTLIGKSYMIEPTNISPQNTIITNQTQWNTLISQMDSNSNVSNSFTTTIIDFSLYNLVVVKSEYSEKIDGFVGGYCTPEDVATNYFGLSNFLTWSFFIVNIILFLSRFFLKTKPNVNSKNESSPKLIFTILLILSSIILCFISLIFTVFLDELWYINIC